MRRTWRRAELVARFRRHAARLISYLGGRPRWLLLAVWLMLADAPAGALGAWLVLLWARARYGAGGLAA